MVRFIGKEAPELSREKAMLECYGSLGLELCPGDVRTCTLQNRPDYAVRDCTIEVGLVKRWEAAPARYTES